MNEDADLEEPDDDAGDEGGQDEEAQGVKEVSSRSKAGQKSAEQAIYDQFLEMKLDPTLDQMVLICEQNYSIVKGYTDLKKVTFDFEQD